VEQISRWEGLNTYYEAALSPDNKWIAMFLMDARLRNFFLVSLETDEIKYLGFTQKFFGAMNSPTNIPILIIWFRLEFGVWPLKKGTLENKLTNLISTKVLKCDKILPYPHIGVAL